MYKQVETEKTFDNGNGVMLEPIATLEEDGGCKCQVISDDGCYVLFLQQPDGYYEHTSWIFKEALEVLKTLPSL